MSLPSCHHRYTLLAPHVTQPLIYKWRLHARTSSLAPPPIFLLWLCQMAHLMCTPCDLEKISSYSSDRTCSWIISHLMLHLLEKNDQNIVVSIATTISIHMVKIVGKKYHYHSNLVNFGKKRNLFDTLYKF